jgi:hypothetical protein
MLNILKAQNADISIEDTLPCQFLSQDEMVTMGKTLNSRAYKFALKLDELRLPLRYAIMSLLSLKRVSIFNESIVSFINLLATDPKWNSSRFAEYGSYLID